MAPDLLLQLPILPGSSHSTFVSVRPPTTEGDDVDTTEPSVVSRSPADTQDKPHKLRYLRPCIG